VAVSDRTFQRKFLFPGFAPSWAKSGDPRHRTTSPMIQNTVFLRSMTTDSFRLRLPRGAAYLLFLPANRYLSNIRW